MPRRHNWHGMRAQGHRGVFNVGRDRIGRTDFPKVMSWNSTMVVNEKEHCSCRLFDLFNINYLPVLYVWHLISKKPLHQCDRQGSDISKFSR
jgi:hypothetical protein